MVSSLPAGWEVRGLYNVAEYINGRATKPAEVKPSGVPVIKIAELNNGLSPKTGRVDAQAVQDKHWVREGDLLFAWSGSVGIHLYRGPRAALNQHIFRVVAREGIDQRFLRYLLEAQMPTFVGFVENKKTTMGHVTVRDLKSITVAVPPFAEQCAIAHILGTLDDKIELNRRMCDTLEAMARALFKSWFVDFDPVRAKAEGRDPALPQPLADLFPARLVDSELGEIPEGWEVRRFGDVVEHIRDNENPLESADTVFRHFSIPAFDGGQWPKQEIGENIKSVKSRVPPWVVLLSKLNPEIERVWLVDVEPGARAVCSTEFLVLAPRAPHGRAFAYCLARAPLFRQELESLVTGTSKSHQRAHVDSILGLSVAGPPASLLYRFEDAAEPLLARSLECRRESCTLANLRDVLLPHLICGELRIKDSGSFVERVGA